MSIVDHLDHQGELHQLDWWLHRTWTEDTIAPYSAGLFDGEGCIALQRTSGIYRGITLRVGSVDRSILVFMQQHFGGTIRPLKRRRHWQQFYEWTLGSNQQVRSCLLRMLPWLHTKQLQAILALNYLDLREPVIGRRRARQPATWQWGQEIGAMLRLELHRRVQ